MMLLPTRNEKFTNLNWSISDSIIILISAEVLLAITRCNELLNEALDDS